MKREGRRIALVRRQAMLARLGERAAMRALADALGEAARSEALAVRSRGLLEASGSPDRMHDAAALVETRRFAGALARLAREADQARNDADRQAAWQAGALAAARTKADRLAERLEAARASDRLTRERREIERQAMLEPGRRQRLARDVQTHGTQAHDEVFDAPSPAVAVSPHGGRTAKT
ncbi:MAG: hypothetical protein V2J14_01170 [Erythrobacter sp.]|jgi:hypothetical protein|nr:hypothetical protein [Erythrobacter sp.]